MFALRSPRFPCSVFDNEHLFYLFKKGARRRAIIAQTVNCRFTRIRLGINLVAQTPIISIGLAKPWRQIGRNSNPKSRNEEDKDKEREEARVASLDSCFLFKRVAKTEDADNRVASRKCRKARCKCCQTIKTNVRGGLHFLACRRDPF